jgi:hypothetical protein
VTPRLTVRSFRRQDDLLALDSPGLFTRRLLVRPTDASHRVAINSTDVRLPRVLFHFFLTNFFVSCVTAQ